MGDFEGIENVELYDEDIDSTRCTPSWMLTKFQCDLFVW